MPGLRLYCDQDSLNRGVIAALRRAGWDVLTAPEAGMAERSDEDQLLFAASLGRVIYTANVGDFARLHAEYADSGPLHAGIIVRAWQQMPIGEQVRGLSAVAQAHDAATVAGHLVYLDAFTK